MCLQREPEFLVFGANAEFLRRLAACREVFTELVDGFNRSAFATGIISAAHGSAPA